MTKATATATATEVRARLIGTWRLVSYETVERDAGKPFGDAVGRSARDEPYGR